MSRLSQLVQFTPQLRTGLGGNYYVISTYKDNLIALCVILKKAKSSVYFSKKHKCWTLRVKDKKQKQFLRTMFNDIEDMFNRQGATK